MIGVVTKGAGDAWEWEWVGVDSGGARLLATSAPLYLSEAQALANGMVILSQCRDWPVDDLCEA